MEKKQINFTPVDAVIEDDKDDLVSEYLIPSASCPCCNIPGVSLKINEAFLNGLDYKQIIEQYGDIVIQRTGRKLDQSSLSEHFTEHFNDKAAAIAHYNRKRGTALVPVEEKKAIKNIFDMAVQERINDLEFFELSCKEQIKRLQELEDIKKERIEQKRIFGLDELIMKQHQIVDSMQTQILSKLKIWQRAKVQNKAIEMMDRQLQWIDPDGKTEDFLGIKNTGSAKLDPSMYKNAERLYLKVVISSIMSKLHKSVDITLKLDQYTKIDLFKELSKQFEGIEDQIDQEFKIKLQEMKEVQRD